jgi:hypothetical protein
MTNFTTLSVDDHALGSDLKRHYVVFTSIPGRTLARRVLQKVWVDFRLKEWVSSPTAQFPQPRPGF